jgi:hypothetical protein
LNPRNTYAIERLLDPDILRKADVSLPSRLELGHEEVLVDRSSGKLVQRSRTGRLGVVDDAVLLVEILVRVMVVLGHEDTL